MIIPIMVTIGPSDRKTTYDPVAPTMAFPVDFPLFANEDLAISVNNEPRTDFTVYATYIGGVSTDAVVSMNVPVVGNVIILGLRSPRRENQFQNGAPLPIDNFNLALNILEAENQEERRDIDINTADIAQEIIARETAETDLYARLDSLIGTVSIYATAAAESAEDSAVSATASAASATEAGMYASMLNTAAYDFNFDSDPSGPGYDWNS